MTIGIKLTTVKDGHDTLILHVTVLYDGIKDNLFMSLNILKLLPSHLLQELRYREYRTRTKPTAHMVTTDMPEH